MIVNKNLTLLALCLISFEILAQLRWNKVSDFAATGRESVVSFSIGNKVYISTGASGSTRYRDTWEYNTDSKTWTQKADFQAVRSAATGFALENKGYLTTGWNGTTRFNDTWAYNPNSNSWTRVADFPGDGRTLAVSFVIDNEAYVGLGGGSGSTRFKDFWAYNANSNTWRRVADFGSGGRTGSFSFSIAGLGYVGMGNNGLSFLNDFWKYDPATNQWTQLKPIPASPRSSGVGAAVGSTGFMGLGANGVVRLSDFWAYQPLSDSWTRLENFAAGARDAATAIAVQDELYVGFGFNGSVRLRDFWLYKNESQPLQILTDTLPDALVGSAYSFTLKMASNLSDPFWIVSSGQLPEGITLESNTGVISGTSAKTGVFEFEVVAFTNENIVSAGQTITASSNNYPVGESPGNLIDGSVFTKYLNFDKKNTFITIDTERKNLATSLVLTTANDALERDPLDVAVLGSNDAVVFNPIDTIAFFCQENRLLSTQLPIKTSVPYRYFRLVFLSVCNENLANSVQAAELQLKQSAYSYRKTFRLTVNPGGNWTRKLDLGMPLQGAVAFSVNEKSYVCTGKTNKAQKAVWQYDGKVWTQKADFPGEARFDAVGFAHGDFGYLATGTTGNAKLRDFWRYNPSNDTWTRLSDFGGEARSGASAFVLGNDFYLGLGEATELKNDLWKFSSGAWTRATDFGGLPTHQAVAWSLDGSGYIASGETTAGLSTELWKFDGTTWSKEQNLPTKARKGAISFAYEGYAYLGLGLSDRDTLSDFWQYDPKNKVWNVKTDFFGPKRVNAVGFALQNKGFIAAGSLQKDLWQYDLNCGLGQIFAENKKFAANQGSSVELNFFDSGFQQRPIWSAVNLPLGLTINPQTGKLSGIAAQSGQYQGLILAAEGGCEQSLLVPFSVSQTGAWIRGSNFGGVSRTQALGFEVNGKGYIIGGGDSLFAQRRDFWQYDPITGKWSQKKDVPFGRRLGMVGFTIDQQAYVGMGLLGNDNKKDFWRYDPKTDSWTEIASIPEIVAGWDATSFILQGKAYVGLPINYNQPLAFPPFLVYDPINNQWNETSPVPQPFPEGKGAFATSNYAYVLTDEHFFQYDPIKNSWIQKPYPQNKSNSTPHKLVQTSSGGLLINSDGSCMYYDEFAECWLEKAKLPTAIIFQGQFSIKDTLYSIAGSFASGTPTYHREVWKYHAQSTCEVTIENESLPAGIANLAYKTTFLKLKVNSLIEPEWKAENLPKGIHINPTTGEVSGTPTESGVFDVEVSVFYENCSKSKNFNLEIRDAPSGAWVERNGLRPDLARRFATGFALSGDFYIGLGNDKDPKRDFWAYSPQTNLWRKRADFPGNPREQAMAFLIDGKAYVGGGKDGATVFGDFWSYDPITDRWTQIAPLPVPIESGVAFALNGEGFVGLGSAGKSFWSYSPQNNSWTAKKEFAGQARKGASAFVVENRAFLGLGDEGTRFLQDFWSYDDKNDSWKKVADFPSTPRAYATCFTIDSYAWVGSGFDGRFMKDFWQYDIKNNVWIEVSEFSGSPRSAAIAVSIGENAYLATGNDGQRKSDLWQYRPKVCNNVTILPAHLPIATKGLDYQAKIFEKGLPNSTTQFELSGLPQGLTFNPTNQTLSGKPTQTGTFNVVAQAQCGPCIGKKKFTLLVNEGNSFAFLPKPLSFSLTHSSVFTLGDTAYFVGGETEDFSLSTRVWKYNTKTEEVSFSENFLASERKHAIAFSIGNKGYVGLGESYGVILKDLWEYNPQTGDWVKMPDLPGIERTHAAVFVVDSIAYIGTGRNIRYEYLSDFWSFNPNSKSYFRIAPIPSPRAAPVAWSLSKKGYIVSGDFDFFDNGDLFWVYSPSTNTWTSKPLPTFELKRSSAVGFELDEKGYMSLGYSNDPSYLNLYSDLWRFDPLTDEWKKIFDFLPELPYLFGGVGFANKESGFIGLGSSNSIFYNHFFKLSPVCPAASISPQSLPERTASEPYSVKLEVNGLDGQVSWNANPLLPLPEGLQLDQTSGILFGTPTQSGPVNLQITATNGFCSANQLYFQNLTVWDGTRWTEGQPNSLKTAAIAAPYNTAIHGSFTAKECFNLSILIVGQLTQIKIDERFTNLGSTCVEGDLSFGTIVGNPLGFSSSPQQPRLVAVQGYNRADSTSNLDISWTPASDESFKLVVLKAGSPVNPDLVFDGSIYAANPDWQGFSDQIDGGKAVYQGKGNFVQVRNLTGKYQNYFASVFEYTLQEPCGAVYSNPLSAQIVASLGKTDSFKTQVYPNPAKNTLFVRTEAKTKAHITDLLGTIVVGFDFENQKEIDVSKLPRGLYHLHLKSEKGTQTHRIVLE